MKTTKSTSALMFARRAVAMAEKYRAASDCRMARFWMRQHVILRHAARAIAKQAKAVKP